MCGDLQFPLLCDGNRRVMSSRRFMKASGAHTSDTHIGQAVVGVGQNQD